MVLPARAGNFQSISPAFNMTVDEGSIVTLDGHSSDPDSGDTVTVGVPKRNHVPLVGDGPNDDATQT